MKEFFTDRMLEQLWVIVKLGDELYGLPSEYAKEMLVVPPVTRMPGVPKHVRGIINLRGTLMPIIDTRQLLGMPSLVGAVTELVDNLSLREQEHKNWINNLEKSVESRAAFTGELDPHRCAFGKWYDSYETDNVFLARVLRQFDVPHKRIHGIATDVKALEARGEYDAALKLVDRTRGKELAKLVALFEEARQTVIEYVREIALVLSQNGANIALTVDEALSVELLDPASFDDMPLENYNADGIVAATARRKESNEVVLLLDTSRVFKNESQAATV